MAAKDAKTSVVDVASFSQMLAQRVRKERLARNLSQDEVAARCRLSRSVYQHFELTGRTSLSAFIKILLAFDRIDELQAIFAQTGDAASSDELQWEKGLGRNRASKKKRQPWRARCGG